MCENLVRSQSVFRELKGRCALCTPDERLSLFARGCGYGVVERLNLRRETGEESTLKIHHAQE
jgi:hypothetical protein